jgi:hypothetical protein
MIPRALAFLVAATFALHFGAADPVANCGHDVKPDHIAKMDEYYPRPCNGTPFSVAVEFTVGTDGAAHDVLLSGLDSAPQEKRGCLKGPLEDFVVRAVRFQPQAEPCRYRMRGTWVIKH